MPPARLDAVLGAAASLLRLDARPDAELLAGPNKKPPFRKPRGQVDLERGR